MKKAILLSLTIIISLCLFGCMDRTNLKERALISGFAIDLNENGFEVGLEIFDGEEALEPKTANVTVASGKTIAEAIDNAGLALGRSIFLGQNRIVILGEKLAKSGISEVISYFNESGITLRNVELAVSEGSAVSLLKDTRIAGETPSKRIEKIIKSSEKNGLVAETLLYEYERGSYFPFQSAVLPVVSVKNGENADEIAVTKSGVFKDDKQAAVLSKDETAGYLWLQGKVKKTKLTVEEEKENFLVNVTKAKSEVNPSVSVDGLKLEINIEAKGQTAEETDESKRKAIAKICEEKIKSECHKAIDSALIENKADVFSFTSAVWRKIPDEFKKMKGRELDLLQKADIKINVSVKLT